MHSRLRQLKPLCFCPACQTWSFDGHRPCVLIRTRGQILSASDLPGKHTAALLSHEELLSLLSRVIKCASHQYCFYQLQRELRFYVPNSIICLSEKVPLFCTTPCIVNVKEPLGLRFLHMLFWTEAPCNQTDKSGAASADSTYVSGVFRCCNEVG